MKTVVEHLLLVAVIVSQPALAADAEADEQKMDR